MSAMGQHVQQQQQEAQVELTDLERDAWEHLQALEEQQAKRVEAKRTVQVQVQDCYGLPF